MDKLRCVEALGVVSKRFSDSCDVVTCILEFYKEMASAERRYSSSINKLLESANYTFHSNILMQWLGSDPFEEIGSMKKSWQSLGKELKTLADLHAEKANSFASGVRQPLLEVLPQLEEERKKLKVKKIELEARMREAQKKFDRVKKRYFQVGDSYSQLIEDKTKMESIGDVGHLSRVQLQRVEKKLLETKTEFLEQEDSYTQAHRKMVDAQQTLNDDLAVLFTDIQERELNRVEKVAKSLQEFARTLSNTAPAYLESMQRIVISAESISGPSDIESFVNSYPEYHQLPDVPSLMLHEYSSIIHDEDVGVVSGDVGVVKGDASVDQTTSTNVVTGQVEDANNGWQRTGEEVEGVGGEGGGERGTHNEPQTVESVTSLMRRLEDNSSVKKPSLTIRPIAVSRSSSAAATDVTKRPPVPSTKPRLAPQYEARGALDRREKQTPSIRQQQQQPQQQQPLPQVPQRTHVVKPSKQPHLSYHYSSSREMVSSESSDLLRKLQRQAATSDYYALLGVDNEATDQEIAKARRELTSRLHPDHYTGDPEQQARAQEQLVAINQAYNDVLKNESTRELYDNLCRFRRKYAMIVMQQLKALTAAKTRLTTLYQSMKKARMPLPLLEELQTAIQLIKKQIDDQENVGVPSN